MQDEIRVTVIATGPNRGTVRQPLRVPEKEAYRAPVKLVRNGTNGGWSEFGVGMDAVSTPPLADGGPPPGARNRRRKPP